MTSCMLCRLSKMIAASWYRAANTGATAGVIDEVIYFGDMTYYDVYLGGTDVEVRLSMRNVPGRPILDVGTKVRVAWSPSALVLFR